MSETLSRSMDLPSIKARLHQNLPLVGRRLLFYEHPTTVNFASLRLRPDQERTQGQAKPLPA